MGILTATFADRPSVENAIDDLVELGIPRDDLSVVMSTDTQKRAFHGERDVHGASVAKGAAGGAALGGSLGAIAGGFLLGGTLTAVTGGLALPFLVAGPLAGALAGGGAGAAVGSVLGALGGLGVPDREAHAIESDVKSGGIVLVANVPAAHDRAARVLMRRDGGGVEPGTYSTAPSVRGDTMAPASYDDDSDVTTGTLERNR